jgi:CheY-like chemotaxis protein
MPNYQAIIMTVAAVFVLFVIAITAAGMIRRRVRQQTEMRKMTGHPEQNAVATPRGERLMDSFAPRRGSLGWVGNERSAGSDVGQDAFEMQQAAVVGRQKTILVADDDPVVLAMLTQRLQRMGFQVIRSPDSAHALFGAVKMLPDLIILDINMPSGNGLAVCEMMACDQRCAHIPVILHTEFTDKAVMRRCERLGAHYVQKSARSWTEIKLLVESLIGEQGTVSSQAGDVERRSAAASSSSRRTSAAAADSTAAAAAPAQSAPAVGQRLVLCIEYPKGRLEAIEQQLAAVGIQASRSADLQEGFWMCFTEQPSAIVVQVANDKKGLLDLLSRLAEHPVTRKIPVLVVNENEAISADDLPAASKVKILAYPVEWEDLLYELKAYCPVFHQNELISSGSEGQAAPVTEHGESHPSASESRPTAGDATERHLVVLCIDDDPVVAKSIAHRLQPYQIKLRWANSGTQGYIMASTEKPDLILLDLKMPGGDGTYTLVKIKENPHTKGVPVVVLTVEKHPGMRRQMFSIGADAYLTKPIDWPELFTAMSKCIHLPRQLLQDYQLEEQMTLAEL